MSPHRIHYRPPGLLSRRRVRVIYAVGLGVWLTGAAWLVLHYFLQRATPFGTAPHPLEAWMLALHGGFAFLTLWCFGLVWGVHVGARWPGGRRRWSGGALVGLLGWFALSGYLLYYLGDEDWRAATSLAHWVVGLGAPASLLVHRWARGRQTPGPTLDLDTLHPAARKHQPHRHS